MLLLEPAGFGLVPRSLANKSAGGVAAAAAPGRAAPDSVDAQVKNFLASLGDL